MEILKNPFQNAESVLIQEIEMHCAQTMNACSDFTDYFLSAGVCCTNTMEL